MKGAAALCIEVAAHGFRLDDPAQPGFLPGLAQRRLRRRLAPFDAALGEHPAFAVARCDQANLAEPEGNYRCL